MTVVIAAFNEGVKDRREGLAIWRNPYLLESDKERWIDWRWGWTQEDRYIRGLDIRIAV